MLWLHIIVLGAVVIASVLFILLDGCFISMVENKIIGDHYNIIDPFLEYGRISVNYNNRVHASYCLGLTYICLATGISIVKFRYWL